MKVLSVPAFKAASAFCAALALAIFALWDLAAHISLGVMFDGSEQYLALARELKSGTIFESPEFGLDRYGVFVRTIGYPILLLPALLLEDVAGLERAVSFMHLLLGAGTLVILISTFVKNSDKYSIIAITAPYLALGFLSFSIIMPEWLAINCQLAAIAFLYRYLSTNSISALVVSGFIAAFLTIVRPEFLPWPVIIGFILLFAKHFNILLRCSQLLIVFAPIIVWLTLNYQRTGLVTLSPLGTFSLYGLASGLSQSSENLSLEPRRSIGDNLLVPFQLEGEVATELVSILNDNFRLPCERLISQHGGTWRSCFKQMQQQVSPLLFENFRRYLSYLAYGIIAYFSYLLPLQLFPLLPLVFCFLRRRQIRLAQTLSVLWILHLCRGLLVVAVTVPVERYVTVSLVPLTILSVLLCAKFLSSNENAAAIQVTWADTN